MIKVPTASALALAFAAFVLSQTSRNLYDSRPNQSDMPANKVDNLFAPWSKGDTPGAAVIVIKDGRVLLKKGYGLANLESRKPIEPDTAFLLGSVTKQFTAMAIMMLAERGKLRCEDSLSKFFPEFPPYSRQITVRHLLHHLAGFPEYDDLFVESGKIDKDWPRSAKSKPSSFEPTAKDALAVLAQVKELRFIPGEKWEYSNSGYVILAQIVEKVSGQSFSGFLQQNIFGPLGLKRSLLYDETRPKVQNVATSYTLKDGVYKGRKTPSTARTTSIRRSRIYTNGIRLYTRRNLRKRQRSKKQYTHPLPNDTVSLLLQDRYVVVKLSATKP